NSLKRCYRSSQRYRDYNYSEAIENCQKRLDPTDHTGQFVEGSENLRTVRIIPMKFVSNLATKYSSDFEVDKASDSKNLPIDNSESRKALDVSYYGSFRARKIKITPAMKFRKIRPMSFVSKLATKNSPDFQVDNTVPNDISKSRKASNVPYYGPFRARLLKIIPAIKTKRYRSVEEYYSSEREYMSEIPNDKREITKHPVIVKETDNKPTDSKIVSDTCDDTISRHICSEFDEIPLFMQTIPKIDDQKNSLSTNPKIDDRTNSLSTIPKIHDRTNSLPTIPKINVRTNSLSTIPNIDDRTNSLSTIPKIDDRTNSLPTIPKIDDRTESLSIIPKIDSRMNSSGSSSATTINKFEVPEKLLEKNSIFKENRYETGRETLMEVLALLKHRKKEYDENLSSNKKKQLEIIPEKNPEIGENLDGKMQKPGIKKIAAHWYKKTFKNSNKLEKYLQKSEPSQIDRNLNDKQDDKRQQGDKINPQTISQNVDNTSSIDISSNVNSSKSKLLAEIR
ncbi:unnamed protein product, partial [Onchocerca flexuosa]|uniref:TPR_REGION domain-containing protein n=1 Tax=Onchocerca flexuosa TaxID=387005 RepID=A0A183HPB7_9BILA